MEMSVYTVDTLKKDFDICMPGEDIVKDLLIMVAKTILHRDIPIKTKNMTISDLMSIATCISREGKYYER